MDSSDFYLDKNEPIRGCLLAIRDILLENNLSETVKYGMPCFQFDGKALCYLWTDKDSGQPYILFVDGQLLTHPRLEAGKRKRMKILRIDPNEDLPLELLNGLFSQCKKLR